MKLQKLAGATSNIWQIFIRNSSSTTGAGLTGLTNASGSLTAYYHRDTDTTATVIALVSMTAGTFTSSGFIEIDSAHMPGWYQFCPPDAALASGAKSVAVHLRGATNMADLPIEVQLTAVNPDSATAFMTSVASVVGAVGSVTGAVGSVTGAVGSVTGAVGSVTARVTANADQLAGQTITAAAGVTFPASVASPTNITAGTITTVTNLTNAPTNGDLTAAMIASVTAAATAATPTAAAVTGNIGGNVTGSVGSVVGAVGSVTTRVTANTDQLAGQTVTAAAGVTFPSSVASPTNITAGTITTVTNLTNAPTNGDLTAAMKASVTAAATAATPTVASVSGSVGSVAGNVGGSVVGSLGGDVLGNVNGDLLGTVGAVFGLNPALIDVATSTRLASASYTAPPSAATITTAVWDEPLAGHTTPGTAGADLASAASGTDPWATLLPGAYTIGMAGHILGTNLDDTISSRASPTNITAGTITTVSGNVNGSVGSVVTGVAANITQMGGQPIFAPIGGITFPSLVASQLPPAYTTTGTGP